jgi:hypothetical protein
MVYVILGLIFNVYQIIFMLELKCESGHISYILSDISRALYTALLYLLGKQFFL